MQSGACTPIEVSSVVTLHPDYDLAVRCLEYIRLNFDFIIPEYAGLPVQLLALCHHHPNNLYPTLATTATVAEYPDLTVEEIENFTQRIDAWVKAQTLSSIVSQAQQIAAPSWSQLRDTSSP
ncbi:hypothetical protein CfE428DRAFT_1000 [Chthoniobacter flavus Ellin428]|uniref:Uncharacterized protein n=1 Tax=Chthoniobacter flavus Ellin428 TaxID=497964 RepID=B4CWG3_9BACT|nr:hypothetical protein [Chthoniobacter flavus]EDY21755.1 hypothetical protein CfE428DRAFT_1000 [Chthoniobacter flavus Ellin428]TCO95687.1 hypothetical protein EV701_101377 [Chthoniobacter flavus]